MVAIRSYFTFIILVMGTMSVAQDISAEQEEKFIQDIIRAHNKYRSIHGSGKLERDDELCKIAKKRAISMKTTYYDYLSPYYDFNYTTRDFDGTSDLDPYGIVETWYENGKSYDYNNEPRNWDIFKFARIVWMNTTKIGVGILVSDNKCYVTVIYAPSGCNRGEYSSNIIHPDEAAKMKKKSNTLLRDLMEESD